MRASGPFAGLISRTHVRQHVASLLRLVCQDGSFRSRRLGTTASRPNQADLLRKLREQVQKVKRGLRFGKDESQSSHRSNQGSEQTDTSRRRPEEVALDDTVRVQRPLAATYHEYKATMKQMRGSGQAGDKLGVGQRLEAIAHVSQLAAHSKRLILRAHPDVLQSAIKEATSNMQERGLKPFDDQKMLATNQRFFQTFIELLDIFKVLAGTGLDAADGPKEGDGPTSRSGMRKALESIKHASLDGKIELRLFCVDRVGQPGGADPTQRDTAGASGEQSSEKTESPKGSLDIREVVHVVSVPDAVLSDAKRAIAGQGELRSQAQWLAIAVQTVRSLLREIGEPVRFELDPDVQRVLMEGGEDAVGGSWRPGEGESIYEYDDDGRKVSKEQKRARPRGESLLGAHDSVFRSVGRYAPQVQGKIFTFPELHLDQLSTYTDSQKEARVTQILDSGIVSTYFLDEFQEQVGRSRLSETMLRHFDAVYGHHPLWSVASVVLARSYDFVPDTMAMYLPFDMEPRRAAIFIRDHTEELERHYEQQLGQRLATHTSRSAELANWEEETRRAWVRHAREQGRHAMSAEDFREQARRDDMTSSAPTDAEDAAIRAEVAGSKAGKQATAHADTWARGASAGTPWHGSSAQASGSKSGTERHQQASRGGGAGGLLSDLPWWMRADAVAEGRMEERGSGVKRGPERESEDGAGRTPGANAEVPTDFGRGVYEWEQRGPEDVDDWELGAAGKSGGKHAAWTSMEFDRTVGGQDRAGSAQGGRSSLEHGSDLGIGFGKKRRGPKGAVASLRRSAGRGASDQVAGSQGSRFGQAVGDHRPPVLATGLDLQSMREAWDGAADAVERGDTSLQREMQAAAERRVTGGARRGSEERSMGWGDGSALPRGRSGAMDFDEVGADQAVELSRRNALKRMGAEELLRQQSGLDMYDSD